MEQSVKAIVYLYTQLKVYIIYHFNRFTKDNINVKALYKYAVLCMEMEFVLSHLYSYRSINLKASRLLIIPF